MAPITPELITYVKEARASGMSRDETIRALLKSGWDMPTIQQVLAFIDAPVAAPPAVPQAALPEQNPVATHPVAALPAQTVVTQNTARTRSSVAARSLAVFIACVVVLGGGAGAAYAFVPAVKENVTDYFATPNERVLLALQKLTSVPDTYSFSGTASSSVETSGTATSANPFAALVLGMRTSGTFSGQAARGTGAPGTLQQLGGDMSFSVTVGGLSMNVAGSLYATPRVAAIKIDQPDQFLFVNLKPILGKWIAVSKATSTAAMPGMSAASVPTDPALYQETLAYAVAHANEFLSVAEIAPNESVNGQTARHYKEKIDTGALIETLEQSPLFMASSTAADKIAMRDALSAASTTSMSADMWIGTANHYPLRVTLHERIPHAASSGIVAYDQVLDVDVTFSNFNEPFTRTAPTTLLTPDEVTTLLQGTANPVANLGATAGATSKK